MKTAEEYQEAFPFVSPIGIKNILNKRDKEIVDMIEEMIKKFNERIRYFDIKDRNESLVIFGYEKKREALTELLTFIKEK